MAKANKAATTDAEVVAVTGDDSVAAEPSPAVTAGVIATIEARSRQALAEGDYRKHAALDQLVSAAHHLKSRAQGALEMLSGEDAELIQSVHRTL